MNIEKAIFSTYQWMRAAKAWRITLELPPTAGLASLLIAIIETEISITIKHSEKPIACIDPCFIVDVAHKRKKFFLVLETTHERQNIIAALLPALVEQQVDIEIGNAPNAIIGEAPKRGTITQMMIKGLHQSLFKNSKFQNFIEEKTGIPIFDEKECKQEFKSYMGVSSCVEIDATDFKNLIADFNASIGGGKKSVD